MEKFCEKCGGMIEPEEEENLKIEERGKSLHCCLECASWIRLTQLFEDQPGFKVSR